MSKCHVPGVEDLFGWKQTDNVAVDADDSSRCPSVMFQVSRCHIQGAEDLFGWRRPANVDAAADDRCCVSGAEDLFGWRRPAMHKSHPSKSAVADQVLS